MEMTRQTVGCYCVMRQCRLFMTVGVLQIMLFPLYGAAQHRGPDSAACKQWDAKVDSSVPGKTSVNVAALSDNETTVAMGCLLKHRGDRRSARFSGATSSSVSQVLPDASIELASLYYISYLFTSNWQHGYGVALWNRDGVINPPGAVEAAYDSYSKWFTHVQTIGLATARKENLDPLQGTNLHWYGK